MPARLPDSTLNWPICMGAVAMIAMSEGCRLRAYRCPANVWTIGWGRTDGVKPGQTCTQEQADAWLCADLTTRAAQVQAMLAQHAEPNQLGALVSLSYNIGLPALEKSTVLRAHNAGDTAAAARAFALWNKARVNGALTELPGLTSRRAAEAALYLTPEADAPLDPVPQAVAPESSLAASPIARAGAATAASGGLLVVQQLGEQAGQLKEAVSSMRDFLVTGLGVPTHWALPVLLLAAGAACAWYRWKQRRGGWA